MRVGASGQAHAYARYFAETTKQLKVSKELQRDAEVMVRRSERALGVAIREGQERGEIASKGRGAIHVHGVHGTVSRSELITTDPAVMSSPYDYAKHTELYGDGKEGGNGVYAMAEATDDQFEAALAREEGNPDPRLGLGVRHGTGLRQAYGSHRRPRKPPGGWGSADPHAYEQTRWAVRSSALTSEAGLPPLCHGIAQLGGSLAPEHGLHARHLPPVAASGRGHAVVGQA